MNNESKNDFYLGDKNLPTANAQHEYDENRIKEIIKCSKDIIHFASNYFFITSLAHGKELIGLYSAQKRIIKNLVKHRFNILLSCRQAGKCFLGDTKIKIHNKKTQEVTEISINKFYFIFENRQERRSYTKMFGFFNRNKKIIKSYTVDDYDVWTDTGWQPISSIHKTILYDVWELKTENGKELRCADDHIIIDEHNNEIFTKDIIANKTRVITESGIETIISIEKLNRPKENMYDVSVKSINHTLFTNGINSHNTTLMTVYSLWFTCFQADKRVLIVANKEDTAKMILRRIKMAYEKLPNWMKPGIKQWDKTEVIFANDSSISISTTTSSAARGESINVLIIDEAAHIAEHILNEFWNSVIPVISSHSSTKLFVVSTPNGTGNKFYEIYSQAERGELKEWYHDRIDWWEVPGRDLKWKASMQEILAKEDKNFNQEFNNEFVESGQSAIDGDVIETFRRNSRKPTLLMEDGKYKIWEMPNDSHLYVIGVDVGEGIGQAASVAQVLDITDLTNIKQVACYHNNAIDPFHFAEILNRMTNQWGKPVLFIERNNCGGQVIDALRHVHYYNNIADYTPDNNVNPDRLGIYSSVACKYEGVMNMRYWVNSLKVVNINDIALVQEMETFVRYPNGTWKSKPGEYIHDDRVMSLVWALFAMETKIAEKYYEITAFDTRGKPMKIEPVNIEPPKYYKLDSMYEDPNAPLPTHVAVNPTTDDDGVDSLRGDGWRFSNESWR